MARIGRHGLPLSIDAPKVYVGPSREEEYNAPGSYMTREEFEKYMEGSGRDVFDKTLEYQHEKGMDINQPNKEQLPYGLDVPMSDVGPYLDENHLEAQLSEFDPTAPEHESEGLIQNVAFNRVDPRRGSMIPPWVQQGGGEPHAAFGVPIRPPEEYPEGGADQLWGSTKEYSPAPPGMNTPEQPMSKGAIPYVPGEVDAVSRARMLKIIELLMKGV